VGARGLPNLVCHSLSTDQLVVSSVSVENIDFSLFYLFKPSGISRNPELI